MAEVASHSRRASRRAAAARIRGNHLDTSSVISISSLMMRVAAALALVLSLSACSRDRALQAAEGQKVRTVKTEAAQIRDVRRQVDVVGTLAAREEVVVSAEVEGRVARLVHDLGDRVAAGAPLIELDQEKLQYRAEAQRAALEQARARYGASGDAELPT